MPLAPMVIQAEQGALGNDFAKADDGQGTQYVTITGTMGGGAPATEARVISFEVEFPAPGSYELYLRAFVGPGGANDDSFFYGNGFGSKDPAAEGDWIFANNLNAVGYSAPEDVLSGLGFAGTQLWKWVRLSAFNGGEDPIRFEVPEGQLRQTFQIGGREDGLRIDQFAFVPAGIYQTVAQLDQGLPGTVDPPPPPPNRPPPYTPAGPALATGKSKFLGSAYSASQSVDFAAYFNQVTPDNAGKWGAVEPQRGALNFNELDQAYDFARENGFSFKLHTLIWGNQQPAWIESLPPDEQLLEIETWFAELSARYPDCEYVDVVNEALHDPPDHADGSNGNYVAALGGAGESGWDWVINAFRLARFYFPDSQLLINEYAVESNPAEAQRYVDIVTLLQAEDLIDGIGIQAHAFSTGASTDTLRESLDVLAATGLPIYVSELDIDGPTDERQLAEYQRIFPIYWEHPSVQGITLWGYRPGMWRTSQQAFLAYEDGGRRPAFEWLEQYVRNVPPLVFPLQRLELAADAAERTSLGFVQGTDDVPGLQGWQIVGGSGAGSFDIDAATGEVRVRGGAQLGGAGFVTLRVVVHDAFTQSEPATVLVAVTAASPPLAEDAGAIAEPEPRLEPADAGPPLSEDFGADAGP